MFTGAVYDPLSDIFEMEREPDIRDDSETLYQLNQYMLSLTVRAVINASEERATFRDISSEMLRITKEDGKQHCADTLKRNFIRREIIKPGDEKALPREELAEVIFGYRRCRGNRELSTGAIKMDNQDTYRISRKVNLLMPELGKTINRILSANYVTSKAG